LLSVTQNGFKKVSKIGENPQVLAVYSLENYDYNIHSNELDAARFILSYEKGDYDEKQSKAILADYSNLYGTIFKKYDNHNGQFIDFPRKSNRNRTNAQNKSNGAGFSSNVGEEISGRVSDTITKKFSLSEPVEETKDLIAVHNISDENLSKAIKLGGFPMPSIAVTKSDMSHTSFGDISVIFSKETIDPSKKERDTLGKIYYKKHRTTNRDIRN
jgi:hypothetical protein